MNFLATAQHIGFIITENFEAKEHLHYHNYLTLYMWVLFYVFIISNFERALHIHC
jgi:hypothetical protein